MGQTARGPHRAPLGYLQISDLLRARVARGELRPGDRLPTVRDQAADLGVNVNTVARAYAELAREGVLVTHAGGGTHVAVPPPEGPFQQAREARLRDLVGGAVLQALSLGYRPEQIEAAVLGQLARWSVPPEPAARSPRSVEQALLFAGSHDLTLDLLAARLQRREPPVWLKASYVGSLEGLVALSRGEADLAGCHLLDEQTGDFNAPFIARLLPGQPVLLVTLALREQGLLVRAGNPRQVQAMADLVRPDLVVALRQRGSGTRVLLEHLLRRQGLDPANLVSGERDYDTHLAVAAAVAEGAADVGLGIRAAARAYGLDLLPLASERYELAIPARLLEQPAVCAVLETLEQDDFKRTVAELGGYDVSATGQRRLAS